MILNTLMPPDAIPHIGTILLIAIAYVMLLYGLIMRRFGWWGVLVLLVLVDMSFYIYGWFGG
jgi:hypothetical protein